MNNLDRSLSASTAWTANQFSSNASGELIGTDLGLEFATNAALMYMLMDSAAISGDPRLQQLTPKIVAAYREGPPSLMAKLVDPDIAESPRSRAELESALILSQAA
jgi:hypothetical protein